MIYAIEGEGAVEYFVNVPEGWPPYIPPEGMTMREATPEEATDVLGEPA